MARYRCGYCGKKGHNARTCAPQRRSTKKRSVVTKRSRTYRRGTSTSRTRRGVKVFGSGSGWITLYYSDGDKSDKTWAVKLVKFPYGWAVLTRWGKRTGSKTETLRRMRRSKALAQAELQALVRSKLAEGYE